MNKRPLSITLLSYLLIAVGAGGFVLHFCESYKRHSIASDDVWVLAVSLIAIVCGVFLLRGKDWARWLSMAWIAFHVVQLFSFDAGGGCPWTGVRRVCRVALPSRGESILSCSHAEWRMSLEFGNRAEHHEKWARRRSAIGDSKSSRFSSTSASFAHKSAAVVLFKRPS